MIFNIIVLLIIGSIIAGIVLIIYANVMEMRGAHLPGYVKIGATLVITSIVIIALLIIIPQMFTYHGHNYENRCKLTLRALAATQLAYQVKNNNHDFASWDDFIVSGGSNEITITRENLIDNYLIDVFEVKPSSINSRGESENNSTFTIIAIPIKRRHHRTFAINETQTPYVWVGRKSDWERGKFWLNNENFWQPFR